MSRIDDVGGMRGFAAVEQELERRCLTELAGLVTRSGLLGVAAL